MLGRHVALGGFDPSTCVLPLPSLTQNIIRITFLDVFIRVFRS